MSDRLDLCSKAWAGLDMSALPMEQEESLSVPNGLLLSRSLLMDATPLLRRPGLKKAAVCDV